MKTSLQQLEERIVLDASVPVVANPDAYSVTDGDTLVVDSSLGVLANDDSSGFLEVVEIDGTFDIGIPVTTLEGGEVTLQFDGSFSYTTPSGGGVSSDSFTYKASDFSGIDSEDTATVTITILAGNSPPTPADDFATTDEDVSIFIDVLANDSDPDGDPLTIFSFTPGSNGAVFQSGNLLEYVPDPDFNGSDSFSYTIQDPDLETATATVFIDVTSVNDDPFAVTDSEVTNEDTPNTFFVLNNDTDVDGDFLTISSFTQGTHGTVVYAAGSITELLYTPDANYAGSDSFTYTVSDGQGGFDTALVNVAIVGQNDPPTAVDDFAVIDEDTPITISVLTNDSDVDGDPFSIVSFSQGNDGSVAFAAGSTTDLVYTPDPNFNGSDSFTYTISDGNLTDTATVSLTINSVNDPPVAQEDVRTTDEDTPIFIDVISNDSDIDGGSLFISSFTPASNGSVSLISSTVLRYAPNANFIGIDSFTYIVSDGAGGTDTATVTITVNSVNNAPDAVDDAATTNEDTPIFINVISNDSDIDGGSLFISSFTPASNGSVSFISNTVLRYAPNANFNGTDSFTYIVSDGAGGTDTATVTITVNSVNDAPDAVDDAATTNEDTPITISVLTNDSDVEGDPFSIVSFSQGTDGSVAFAAGSTTDLVYTPNPNFNGSDSFTYTISDGFLTDTATVTVTILPVNDAPIASDDLYSTDEDTVLTIAAAEGVLANDTDVENDTLSAFLDSDPLHGIVTLNLDGSFTYTPDADFHGTDSFTYLLFDEFNAGPDSATVTITVLPVNDDPDAVDDAAVTDEDVALLIDVLANDGDIDGDALSINGFTDGANGSVALQGGQLLYTPDADFNGSDSFTYTVTDGQGGFDTATVAITVLPVNDAPDAVDDAATTDQDTAVTIPVLANDTDVDGDALAIDSFGQGLNGSVAQIGDDLIYTPDAGFSGSDSFIYTVSDGNGGLDTATVSIIVTDQGNLPPVAVDDAYQLDYNGLHGDLDVPAVDGVLANDVDPDNDALTALLIDGPDNGQLVFNSDGSFIYTPNLLFDGTDSFTYEVSDGEFTDTGEVSINVNVGPILKLFGSKKVLFIEDHRPRTLAPFGLAVDPFADTYDGSKLVVEILNDTVNDVLLIKDYGKIDINAQNEIFYNGDHVGDYEYVDGTLTIEFNDNASAKIISKVMGRVAYENISDNPDTTTRNVDFTFYDADGAASNVQSKEVRIFSVNDTPDIIYDTSSTTVEEGDTISLASTLGFSITDADDPSDIMQVTLKVKKGTLHFSDSLEDLETIIIDTEEAEDGFTKISFTGSLEELNQALSRLLYTAPDNWTGTDIFLIKVKDFGTSSHLGGTESDWEKFELHIVDEE